MKIIDISLIILEDPNQPQGYFKLSQVPNLRRIQYTHGSDLLPNDKNLRQGFLKVTTDEGIEGMCTTTMTPEQVEILRNQVLDEDPFQRERLYQLLHKGTRWVYQRAGWFGDFDNCLWDILGKTAGLPVYDLIGKVRDVVGPDYLLINDPVCSYSFEEAVEVGHLMEELGFLWLEEPMHEHKRHRYQELCRELTIPVMGNETLMHDIGLSTQWLISGATDLLRANARFGTTLVLKMAHFAELYDTTIEMNAEGGLFGLVHAHLGCCIDNTQFFEAGQQSLTDKGKVWGMTNTPPIAEGHIAPPDGPGWGAEWDWDRFNAMTVEVQ